MLSMGLTDTDRENFLRLYNDIRSGKEHKRRTYGSVVRSRMYLSATASPTLS